MRQEIGNYDTTQNANENERNETQSKVEKINKSHHYNKETELQGQVCNKTKLHSSQIHRRKVKRVKGEWRQHFGSIQVYHAKSKGSL